MSKNDYRQITVGELVALLQKQDPAARVSVEGCDCLPRAIGVIVDKTGNDTGAGAGTVVIASSDFHDHWWKGSELQLPPTVLA